MTTSTLPAELVHRILHSIGSGDDIRLKYRDYQALLQCALVSRMFLTISREALIKKETLELTADDARTTALLTLLEHPGHSFHHPMRLWVSFGNPKTSLARTQQAHLELLDHIQRVRPEIAELSVSFNGIPSADRLDTIRKMAGVAAPHLCRLSFGWMDTNVELETWIECVSGGKCPVLVDMNFQNIHLEQPGICYFSGKAPASLQALTLGFETRASWVSLLDWVAKGGATITSLGLEIVAERELMQAVLHHDASRRVAMLDLISFSVEPGHLDLSQLELLQTTNINLVYPKQDADSSSLLGNISTLLSLARRRSSSVRSLDLELVISGAFHPNNCTRESLGKALDDCLVELVRCHTTISISIVVLADELAYEQITAVEKYVSCWLPRLAQQTVVQVVAEKAQVAAWTMVKSAN